MRDWEPFAGLLALLVSISLWVPWYGDLFRVNRLSIRPGYRFVLGFMPVACLLFLLFCLRTSAAKAVRVSSVYIAVYMALGAATLGVASHFYSFLGISPRDDVLERGNRAALIAIGGAQIGTIVCFTGGNIGEGPGVEVVILSAGTALFAWFVLWYAADFFSGQLISERISVERDTSSGVRLAGLLAGSGLILGAAAAGVWKPQSFLRDFAFSAWPALMMTGAAILLERSLSVHQSVLRSLATALAYFSFALGWVLHKGLEG